jgi:hypothetical protein
MLMVHSSLVFQFLKAFISKLVHVSTNSFINRAINQVSHSFSQIMWNLFQLWIILFLFVTLYQFLFLLYNFFLSLLSKCLQLFRFESFCLRFDLWPPCRFDRWCHTFIFIIWLIFWQFCVIIRILGNERDTILF